MPNGALDTAFMRQRCGGPTLRRDICYTWSNTSVPEQEMANGPLLPCYMKELECCKSLKGFSMRPARWRVTMRENVKIVYDLHFAIKYFHSNWKNKPCNYAIMQIGNQLKKQMFQYHTHKKGYCWNFFLVHTVASQQEGCESVWRLFSGFLLQTKNMDFSLIASECFFLSLRSKGNTSKTTGIGPVVHSVHTTSMVVWAFIISGLLLINVGRGNHCTDEK